jgi:hypothetical protein
VPHNVHPGDAKALEDAAQVVKDLAYAVVRGALGPGRLTEPPEVGRDHAVAGGNQRLDLVAPQVGAVGEAVEEQDAGSGARVDDAEIEAADPDLDRGRQAR